jgi:hypothetical protein
MATVAVERSESGLYQRAGFVDQRERASRLTQVVTGSFVEQCWHDGQKGRSIHGWQHRERVKGKDIKL